MSTESTKVLVVISTLFALVVGYSGWGAVGGVVAALACVLVSVILLAR